MKSLYKLQAEKQRLERKLGRTATSPDSHLDAVARSFHLGMVGGSGPNTAALNRRREASLDRTIDNAVAHVKASKDLAWVNASIRVIEDRPKRLEAIEAAEKRMTDRGRAIAQGLKPGDMVRWIVSGSVMPVIRVNRTSVTVSMCGGEERLKFNEVVAA